MASSSTHKRVPDKIESTPLHNINDPIPIKRDHPIVTQAWTPPYKPAVGALPQTWSTVMQDSENRRKDASGRHSRAANYLGGGGDGGGGFFSPPTASPRSAQPQLPGGSQWQQSGGGGGGGAGFNAFASVMKGGGGGQGGFGGGGGGTAGVNSSRFGGGGGGPPSFTAMMAGAKNLSTLDEDDEYDDRVGMNKQSIATRNAIGPDGKPVVRRKSRKQREEAREQYRKAHEALEASGYHSGGEVDDSCIGPLGDDDDIRADRLKFTEDAHVEDGTYGTAYRAEVAHRRRGNNMRTPQPQQQRGGRASPGDHDNNNNNFDAIADKQSFRAPGLKTPAYDPLGNVPAPVARFQRRQQHHLLRMLGGAPSAAAAHQLGGAHLFPPHEIPVDESQKKKQNKFDPDSWMLGDESVDDVMRRHFLRMKEYEQQQQSKATSP